MLILLNAKCKSHIGFCINDYFCWNNHDIYNHDVVYRYFWECWSQTIIKVIWAFFFCFEYILLIIFWFVSRSNQLNWKEILFFKNVFIVLFLCFCWKILTKNVGPIFWKKGLKLFAISSSMSILSPITIQYDGKYFCCYIYWAIRLWWCKFVLYLQYITWYSFGGYNCNSWGFSLVFHTLVNHKSSINLRRLCILSPDLIFNFIIPIAIHGFFSCS